MHWLLDQQLGVAFDDVPSLLDSRDATEMSRDCETFCFLRAMTSQRELFGGAITVNLPSNFLDASYVVV